MLSISAALGSGALGTIHLSEFWLLGLEAANELLFSFSFSDFVDGELFNKPSMGGGGGGGGAAVAVDYMNRK